MQPNIKNCNIIGAIIGAIAAAFYKDIPDDIYNFVMPKIPDDLKEIVTEFENKNNYKTYKEL